MEMSSNAPIPPLTHAISGALGSATALLAFYPLERARIELQAEATRHSSERSLVEDSTGLRTLSAKSSDVDHSDVSDGDPISQSLYAVNGVDAQRSATTLQFINKPTLRTCLHRLWLHNELYRGLSPIVCTLTISNFIFFYFHTFMKQLVATGCPTHTRGSMLLASCFAGVLNVILTNPLWVANLRIVTNKQYGDASGLWKQMQGIAEKEGALALWQGTWTSILLVSNPVIQFFTYEQFKSSIMTRRRSRDGVSDKLTLSPLEAFVAGAASKTLATLCTYPLQLAQSILRLQRSPDNNPGTSDASTSKHDDMYKDTLDCLLRLYGRGGFASLFIGMKAKLLQTALTAAFTFLTYEQILHAVHRAHISLITTKTMERIL